MLTGGSCFFPELKRSETWNKADLAAHTVLYAFDSITIKIYHKDRAKAFIISHSDLIFFSFVKRWNKSEQFFSFRKLLAREIISFNSFKGIFILERERTWDSALSPEPDAGFDFPGLKIEFDWDSFYFSLYNCMCVGNGCMHLRAHTQTVLNLPNILSV